MDEIVIAALKKWPNVPHCYGWLALDARGDWYLRDMQAQRAGAFPRVKGSRIEHAKLIDFIARNYESDTRGCWFFQNGPQRVYVQLEAAPWVWRVHWNGTTPLVASHTGRQAAVRGIWIDAIGRLYLEADLGFGIVHSQDMIDASQAIEAELWQPQPIELAEAAKRFGYVLEPRPEAD